MFDVTEEMKNAGALAWWGHRCKGASPQERGDDRCWQHNEHCHCRVAYEGAEGGFRAMLANMPEGERIALATELTK